MVFVADVDVIGVFKFCSVCLFFDVKCESYNNQLKMLFGAVSIFHSENQ